MSLFLSLSFAVDSALPGFIQRHSQTLENDKRAVNSTICGLTSGLFGSDLRPLQLRHKS